MHQRKKGNIKEAERRCHVLCVRYRTIGSSSESVSAVYGMPSPGTQSAPVAVHPAFVASSSVSGYGGPKHTIQRGGIKSAPTDTHQIIKFQKRSGNPITDVISQGERRQREESSHSTNHAKFRRVPTRGRKCGHGDDGDEGMRIRNFLLQQGVTCHFLRRTDSDCQ